MTTKSMSYDNAAYLVPQLVCLGELKGNAGNTQRFASFTNALIKSIQLKVVTAGTGASSDVVNMMTVAGTATTTTALATFTATVYTTNVTTTLSLAAGDAIWLTKGTDATEVVACGAELLIVPGASVTA